MPLCRHSVRHSSNRLGRVLALLILSGCGSPASDPPLGTSAIGSMSVSGAREDSDQAITSRQGDGHKVAPSQALAKTPLFTDLPVSVASDQDTAAATHPPSDRPTPGLDPEVLQQEVLGTWSEGARDSPDVSVRLQALEAWAQRSGGSLNPITYGLVDQDESVRERALELYTHQLELEATFAESEKKHEYPAKEPWISNR